MVWRQVPRRGAARTPPMPGPGPARPRAGSGRHRRAGDAIRDEPSRAPGLPRCRSPLPRHDRVRLRRRGHSVRKDGRCVPGLRRALPKRLTSRPSRIRVRPRGQRPSGPAIERGYGFGHADHLEVGGSERRTRPDATDDRRSHLHDLHAFAHRLGTRQACRSRPVRGCRRFRLPGAAREDEDVPRRPTT